MGLRPQVPFSSICLYQCGRQTADSDKIARYRSALPLVFCQNFAHFVGVDFAVYVLAYGHHGRKSAAAYATGGGEGELAVGSAIAASYAQGGGDFIEHLL